MTFCTPDFISLPALKRRKIQLNWSGGSISSDTGVLLLSQIDDKLQLLQEINEAIPDTRSKGYVKHSQLSMIRQRVYGLALGYEDGNDHTALRHDIAFQTAVSQIEPLASHATLCRFENRMDREAAVMIHTIMVNQFIASFQEEPESLILDFDAKDDLVHGNQIGKSYHGYYHSHCFLPLYVTCGEQLLVSYLRPSNIDPAKHSWAILKLLVTRLRQVWPNVRIIFRADGGFCRHRILSWCERQGVEYIVGLARNSVLERKSAAIAKAVELKAHESQKPWQFFNRFTYRAGSWHRSRKVIVKAEVTPVGLNRRFIVTNIQGKPRALYRQVYCARGEMENRIKEQQLGLFADRTSCHQWWPNQFRLLLSSLAYILMERLRNLVLVGTELSRATVTTIRLKLLKVGAVIIRNTRKIQFLLSSNYPYKSCFETVAKRLSPG